MNSSNSSCKIQGSFVTGFCALSSLSMTYLGAPLTLDLIVNIYKTLKDTYDCYCSHFKDEDAELKKSQVTF